MCIFPGFLVTLKVPSGRIGSAWECYHWIGLEKWIQPPTCLEHGLRVLKPRSFPPNCAPKMRERHLLFFGLRLVSKEFQHPAIRIKTEHHFSGFFHQTKVRQPIGRQDSMQTVIRTSRRLDSFLHEAAQNFEVFSNIQEWNLKSKTYCGWCPFQGVSNGTTLLAGRYL